MVYMHDVAQVHNGSAVQTNVVHVDGNRSVLLSVFKNGSTSTLDIVSGIKKMLQVIKPSLPDALEIKPIGDQSVFVRASIQGVIREGVIAAALTSLMILLFLGSWRSTLIVTTSIPLSILGAIGALCGDRRDAQHHDPGRARARGRHPGRRGDGDDREHQLPSRAGQGGGERRSSTAPRRSSCRRSCRLLCICIVFVPMFFLSGVARFLFVPMAESVMFAMVFSFLLSRTLVPTHGEVSAAHARGRVDGTRRRRAAASAIRWCAFSAASRRASCGCAPAIMTCWRSPSSIAGYSSRVFSASCSLSFLLAPFLGRNFFPQVDGGQILLHVRAPVGMRIEETAARFADVEKAIRAGDSADRDWRPSSTTSAPICRRSIRSTTIPARSASRMATSRSRSTPGHAPTADYVSRLRDELPRRFPGMTFSFLPADIVSQILNFGAPAPIDLQIRGNDLERGLRLRQQAAGADPPCHRRGRCAHPAVGRGCRRSTSISTARGRRYTGVTAADVTNSLVVNLASSSQVAPTYWLNEKNGVTYPIALQTPQYQIDTLPALQNLPINASRRADHGARRHRRHSALRTATRWSRSTTSLRWWRSTRRLRGAISARSPPTFAKIIAQQRQGQAEGLDRRPGRPDGDHEQRLLRPAVRPARRDRAHLFPDRDQLPVLERPVRHHHRAAGGARRHRLDAVRDAYDAVGAGADGRDHVHGRGDRQQRAGDQFRAREAQRDRRCDAGRARGRLRAPAPGADDGARDGDRHAADGARPRRGRRAECAARPRRDRRPRFSPPSRRCSSSPSCSASFIGTTAQRRRRKPTWEKPMSQPDRESTSRPYLHRLAPGRHVASCSSPSPSSPTVWSRERRRIRACTI